MGAQPPHGAQLGARLVDLLDSSVFREEVATGDSNIVTNRDTAGLGFGVLGTSHTGAEEQARDFHRQGHASPTSSPRSQGVERSFDRRTGPSFTWRVLVARPDRERKRRNGA